MVLLQARIDIQENIDTLTSTFPLNPEQFAIAGYSNGARAALTLALTGGVRARWVISVGGALQDRVLKSLDWQNVTSMDAPNILLIVGEHDHNRLSRLIEQAKLFELNGLNVSLEVIPKMGYSVPPDLSERVIRWLDQK